MKPPVELPEIEPDPEGNEHRWITICVRGRTWPDVAKALRDCAALTSALGEECQLVAISGKNPMKISDRVGGAVSITAWRSDG